ncbi:unnamed protein product, partial [Arabidopsis halleri]
LRNLANLFEGTVLAYGQTNSGKTHTMRGSTIEPGIISLAVHDLFDIISQDTSREYLLRMSYLEIYNENINDLLDPLNRKLQIHENLEKGVFVAGLREDIVDSPQQVLELMESGESHRHIGETNMNHYSSRSHTIFRMVKTYNVVDLAGSERAAKTGAEGVRLKEGTHINKSLMTLGTVIKKLSEGVENQGGHIPYRDSKLTRILQPALGGNANTAIICNITLALIHVNETKSSLQFASRALRVTNCAHVNEILTDTALLKRQSKEIKELRSKLKRTINEIQIEFLKAKLGEYGLSGEAKIKHLVCGVVGNERWNENVIIREPEAILVVKQLLDKVHFFFSLLTTGTIIKVASLSSIRLFYLTFDMFRPKDKQARNRKVFTGAKSY